MEKDRFISIIRDNRKLIFKICYSYCINHENRKDLEQEIFIQLWKSFQKYDGRVKISTWIYRIALNTAISFYRNDCKVNGNGLQIDESIISLSDTDDDSLELKENISLLYQFIDQLKAFDKAIILLYLDDNKHKDISEILGITETNVATKISRIKRILKEKFINN